MPLSNLQKILSCVLKMISVALLCHTYTFYAQRKDIIEILRKNRNLLFLLCVFVLALISVGQAVTCYVCNYTSSCVDEYSKDPSHEMDCSTGPNDDGYCSKYKDVTRVAGVHVMAGVLCSCT